MTSTVTLTISPDGTRRAVVTATGDDGVHDAATAAQTACDAPAPDPGAEALSIAVAALHEVPLVAPHTDAVLDEAGQPPRGLCAPPCPVCVAVRALRQIGSL